MCFSRLPPLQFFPIRHQDAIADTRADSCITIPSLSSHFFDGFGTIDGDVWLDGMLSHYYPK
jgi:hypothetical protein